MKTALPSTADLLFAFSATLAHRLLTPLSVISNELTCLELSGQAETLRNSRSKLDEIATILRTVGNRQTFLANSNLSLEEIVNLLNLTMTRIFPKIRILQADSDSTNFSTCLTYLLPNPGQNEALEHHGQQYSSLSALFYYQLGINAFEFPLIDALLLEANCSLAIVAENNQFQLQLRRLACK